jgi:hypothetical protein
MQPRPVRGAAIALIVAAIATLPLTSRSEELLDWRPVIAPIDSPVSGSSAQPQLTVSESGVLLSWVESAGESATLKFAERTATGWSAPRTVASGDDWFVNWADVPSVLRLDDGTLAAHWLQKSGAGTYAYDVRLAYSRDHGRTWSESFTPHHDGTKTEHGFASLFQMPGSGLGLIWLDGRNMGSGDHATPGAIGAMSVRFATFDSAWRQTVDTAVDLRVCECCPTSAVVTIDGPIVAYRNRSDEEVRDIYVSRFDGDAWSDPVAVHDDNWRMAACPVNGPMLSARGRSVAIAWFTVTDDVGHSYVAFSDDAGRTFGAPIRLDEESAIGRVDVELLDDGTAVATWIEFDNERSQFSARRVDPSGRRSSRVTVATVDGTRTSGYPRVASAGGELLFAWTESRPGRRRVRTASASLIIAARR